MPGGALLVGQAGMSAPLARNIRRTLPGCRVDSPSVGYTWVAMPALTDFDLADLSDAFVAWGCPPSNARRLLRAFYDGSGRADVESLRIGKKLTQHLADHVPLRQSRVITRHSSADGTTKLL